MDIATRVDAAVSAKARDNLGIVHALSRNGHRGPYLDLFAQLFELAPLSSGKDWASARRLIAAKKLLLVTFDDAPLWNLFVALARAVLFKRTVGLYLRPQECFKANSFATNARWAYFRLIRASGIVRLITITPREVAPRYAEVSYGGVFDPQYWDFHDGRQLRMPRATPLSDEILRIARGRPVITFAGHVSGNKGFPFFVQILSSNPSLADKILFVSVGSVSPDMAADAALLQGLGGMTISRNISDAEIESLYLVSDAMWACYAPSYDQASGIFGRAIQTGAPVIVRRGALIAQIAETLGVLAVPLTYGDTKHASVSLLAFAGEKRGRDSAVIRADAIARWRNDFISLVRRALSLPTK